MIPDATIVLDIGKTNCKLSLIDAAGQCLTERRCPNTIATDGPYPHHDVERLWAWMLAGFSEFAGLARIGAIVPVTHGATAALVDDDGLVLPVLDYECSLPDEPGSDYPGLRPPFAQTQSPALPAGLNLGRQIAWLARRFPAEFGRARHLLMYPQFWAWRLSGVAASEVTSLGCHTDLWSPAADDYSALVEQQGWRALFPPRRPAWAKLGPIKPELAAATGLPGDCQIICGIHDSNASLLRYLVPAPDQPAPQPCTVLSTGTWVIVASLGGAAAALQEGQDMLANCDVFGAPVACMRFMGGREFAALAGTESAAFEPADLARLIARRTLALPSFADSGGPFAGRVGRIDGPPPDSPAEQAALATLYVVLMTDFCLTALAAESPVMVEGSFTRNSYFGPLLAALRPGQRVAVSDDGSGTTCGGWMLHRWGRLPAAHARPVAALELPGWATYRRQWRDAVTGLLQ